MEQHRLDYAKSILRSLRSPLLTSAFGSQGKGFFFLKNELEEILTGITRQPVGFKR